MIKLPSPTRTVEWTRDRINALQTPEVKQLRANAERLQDSAVKELCDAVLSERPRSGVTSAAGTKAKRAKKKASKPAGAPA